MVCIVASVMPAGILYVASRFVAGLAASLLGAARRRIRHAT